MKDCFSPSSIPVEIPGISNAYFLRTALNAIRKYRGEEELDAMDFLPLLREKCACWKWTRSSSIAR